MIISGLKNDFVRVNRDDSIDPLLGLSEAISAILPLTARPVSPNHVCK